MVIVVTCRCGTAFQAPPSLAGRSAACPQCGETLQIPTPPSRPSDEDEVRFACPCGKSMSAPLTMIGQQGKCPRCGDKIIIPGGPRTGSNGGHGRGTAMSTAPLGVADDWPVDSSSSALANPPIDGGLGVPYRAWTPSQTSSDETDWNGWKVGLGVGGGALLGMLLVLTAIFYPRAGGESAATIAKTPAASSGSDASSGSASSSSTTAAPTSAAAGFNSNAPAAAGAMTPPPVAPVANAGASVPTSPAAMVSPVTGIGPGGAEVASAGPIATAPAASNQDAAGSPFSPLGASVPPDKLAAMSPPLDRAVGPPTAPPATNVPPPVAAPGFVPGLAEAPAQNSSTWIPYHSAEDRFSISFPKAPRVAKQSPQGFEVSLTMSDLGADGAYLVVTTHTPMEVAAALDHTTALGAAVDQFLLGMQAKAKGERNIKYGDLSGRELRFEGMRKGVRIYGAARFFRVNGWIYQIAHLRTNPVEPAADVQTFFDSFQPDP